MWRDSLQSSLPERLRGFLRSDIERSEYGCSTTSVIKSKCRIEEVKPGKFVRKCEKTKELLRDQLGRPTELVESKTEYTEEDVAKDAVRFSSPLDERHKLAELIPHIPPFLRSDIDHSERSLFGGLDSFINAAEQRANDFFQNFRFREPGGETQSPFGRFKDGDLERGVDSFWYERTRKRNKPHKKEADYADYTKDFQDI